MRLTANTTGIVKKINEPRYLELMKEMVGDFISFNQIEDAFWFARNLEGAVSSQPGLAKNQPTVYQQCQQLIVAADWAALPHLSEQKVVMMFREHLATALTLEDFDLGKTVNVVLLGILTLDSRDEFKTQLRRAMEANDELLTKNPLMINGQSMPPTIGNWILLYNSRLGTQPVPTMKFSEFMFSKDVTQLTKEEQTRVEKLLRLYEKLKLSSQTLEGYEGAMPVVQDDTPGTIENGNFIPLKVNEAALREYQNIIDRVNAEEARTQQPLSQQLVTPPTITPRVESRPAAEKPVATVDEAVAQAENMLLAETEGDTTKLTAGLAVAIRTNKRDRIIATLLILARLGALRDLLTKNKDLAGIYEQDVVPHLTKKLSIDAAKVTNTYTPAHLREFLKYILTRAVGTEAEAAQYGSQIEEVLQSTGHTEYANMTYFEPRTGVYRWAQAQADDQGNLQ